MTEQPDPITNDNIYVQQRVIADLVERTNLGVKRYGTALQVGNGRRMTQDFREELQDALVYATGIEMADEEISKIVNHLLDIHSDTAIRGVCATCHTDVPCHTSIDLRRVLSLLGR